MKKVTVNKNEEVEEKMGEGRKGHEETGYDKGDGAVTSETFMLQGPKGLQERSKTCMNSAPVFLPVACSGLARPHVRMDCTRHEVFTC